MELRLEEQHLLVDSERADSFFRGTSPDEADATLPDDATVADDTHRLAPRLGVVVES